MPERTPVVLYNGKHMPLPAGDSLPGATSAPHGIQVFTENGTFTVPAGVTKIWVSGCGGGGGGGGCTDTYMKPHYPGGGGGGSGAVAMRHFFPVVPLTEYEVRIGAGGKGNAGNSTEGGDTYFLNATASSHVRLYGGGPGRVGNYPAFYIVSGGDGGKGFSTESGSGRPRTIVNGGSGGFSNDYVVFDNYGITDHDGYGCAGGIGSNTIFGNGGFSGWQGDGGNGFDGTGFGSGGGGGIGAVPSHLRKPITYGGNGAPGILIIEW